MNWRVKVTKSTKFITGSDNIFKDLGFNAIEAKELQFRSTLMLLLNQHIQNKKLTQLQAAKLFGVSQPRISNLISGKIDLFSTSMLLSMLEKAGFKVYERFETLLKEAA